MTQPPNCPRRYTWQVKPWNGGGVFRSKRRLPRLAPGLANAVCIVLVQHAPAPYGLESVISMQALTSWGGCATGACSCAELPLGYVVLFVDTTHAVGYVVLRYG
jgi:hypothetical protein